MSNDDFNDDWSAGASDAMAGNVSSATIDELDLDTEGVDADSFDRGGLVDKPGKYHLEITEAKLRAAEETHRRERPDIQCSCTVLQHVKGQSPAGTVMTHWLEFPIPADKGQTVGKGKDLFEVKMQSFCGFLLKLGVFVRKDGKVIDPETGTTKLAVKTLPNRIVGRQFIGEVVEEAYTAKDGKQKTAIRLHQYHPAIAVDEPAAEGVPVNEEALKLIGKKKYVSPTAATAANGNGNGNGKGGSKATAQAPTQPANVPAAAAAPASDDLDI